MAINRYTQAPIPRFNPMSMQELAYTPTLLRQQHDQALSAAQQIASSLGEYDVLSDYGITAQQAIQPLEQELSQLSEDISTQGIQGSKGIQRAMNLARQRQQLFGQQGAIGQLQGRTQQYRDAAKQIQEDHKSNPLVRDHLLSQLQAGQAQFDSETGQVNLGEFSAPRSVRDIPQEEIIDRINLAVSRLKPSELKGLGIEGVTRVGDFNELVSVASDKGLDIGRITNLISGMIGPEEQASIVQQGAAMGLNPEQSLGAFNQQLQGIANASAYVDRDRRMFNIKDDLALHRARKSIDDEPNMQDMFAVPGGRISSENVNPFSQAKIGADGSLRIGGTGGDATGRPEYIYKNEQGQVVPSSEAIKRHSVRPGSVLPETVLKEGYTQETVISPEVQQLNNEINQQFNQIKNNSPELRGLSNSEALKKINNYFENITQRYGTVISPNPQQAEFLSENILNTLHTRSVYGPEGVGGTQEQLYESLGYSNVNELKEEGKPYLTGLRKLGPQGETVYELTATNSKGQQQSFYTSADEVTNNYTARTSDLGKLIMSAQTVTPDIPAEQLANIEQKHLIPMLSKGWKPVQSDQGDSAWSIEINPIGNSNAEPYKLYLGTAGNAFGNTEAEQYSEIKKTIAGRTASEAKEILKKQYNIPEEGFKIESFSEISRQEDRSILENLGNYWSNKRR